MRALVCLFLSAAISFAMAQSQGQEPATATVISDPADVTICEEEKEEAVFTCILNITDTDIKDDVQWYRFIKDTGTTEMVDLNGGYTTNTNTTGNITNSTLTITNGRKSDTGFVWVEAQSHTYCNTSLTVAKRPSILAVNITENVENLSIVVQWDALDYSLHTVYTVHWTDRRDLFEVATVDDQTSYTITGLTLDTVYIVSITPANIICQNGPEFRVSVTLSNDTTSNDATSSTSSISPTVTATTNTAITNPTSYSAIINPLATNMDVLTLLPTSIIDPSVTVSINNPITIITTMISITSPAAVTSTLTNPGSTATTASTTTSSINPTPSITTTTTTAITTSDITAITTTTTATTVTTTTTPSLAPIDTTATAATTVPSLVPTDTTVTNAATTATTSNTDVAVPPTPTTNLTEPANQKGDDGFNLEDYRYIGAGALGGLIVFIVIVVICCCCCCCRRKRGKRDVGSLKLDQYTTLSSDGSPPKEVPSVTNAMTMSLERDTSKDLDLNSQPLHPPDTYDRLDTIKSTDPTDVYDKLQPRQPLHPTNTYDKLPASNTFDQLSSANTTYDKLPPSKTIHNFPLTNTYDKLPASNTSDNLPSNTTYDKLPSTPPNTYDRLPSSNTFDKLPSTSAYDKLPSSNTFHSFPSNSSHPSTPSNHYDTPPSSKIFEKLPSIPTTSDRLPATDAYTQSLQTKIEEVSDSNANTDDGAHYYDELPCNTKKDAHTGENAYQGEDVHYAILQPLPTPKNKLIYNDDPTKLYAQIA